MASNLSIALIKPNEQLARAIDPLRSRAGVKLIEVKDVQELFELPLEQIDQLDTVFVPLRLESGSTGVSSCVEVRSHPMFHRLPIIGLCITREARVLDSFHEVGADAVYATPFDFEAILSQVRALSRRSQVYERPLEPSENENLRYFTACMHALPEGVIVFDRQGNLYFGNDRARLLFQLNEQTSAEEVESLERFFAPYFSEHKRICSIDSAHTSWFEARLTLGNSIQTISFSISSLESFSPDVAGYCVQVRNSADIQWIRKSYSSMERLRSMLAITQACLTELLPKTSSGILVSPLQRIEEVNRAAARSCSLNAVLTSLLEFMDLVLPPELIIKVSGSDLKLSAQASDLMRMIAYLVYLAADFCGGSGEISIDAGDHIPGEGVTLMVIAQAKSPVTDLEPSTLTNLILNELTNLEYVSTTEPGKISSGIGAAHELARQLRTDLQYQHNGNQLKLRIKLPADLR